MTEQEQWQNEFDIEQKMRVLPIKQEQQTQQALDALLRMARIAVEGAISRPYSSAGESASSLCVARQLAQLTHEVLGCHRLGMLLIEPETQILRPLAMAGLNEIQEQQWWSEQLLQERQLGQRMKPEQIEQLHHGDVLILDMRQLPWKEMPNLFGVQTMLVAPISLGARLLGLLVVDYGDLDHHYTSQEIALTQAVTQLLALAIEHEHLQDERAEAQANEEAARGAESLMDEFIGVAGHELRTPLTTIKASIQMARRQLARALKPQTTLPVETEQSLHLAQISLERAERQIAVQNRLVSDLLEMSRIRANRLELFLSVCDLREVVREVVEDQRILEPEAEREAARRITLNLPESEKVLVLADEDRLRQVVNNYLSNALKYSPTNASIQVHLELRGELAWVAVTDQGPGISAEEQQHIWTRFYRVSGMHINNNTSIAGLGLGLYICRTLIERQGGQVGVESQSGQGSTFWFSLPLAEQRPAENY